VKRVEEVPPETVPEGAPVDVVLDRVVVKAGVEDRLRDTVDHALGLGQGVLRVLVEAPAGPVEEVAYATRPHCGPCDVAYPALTPQRLAFTHPDGACPACAGRGSADAATTPRAKRARGRPPKAPPAPPDEPAPCRACGGGRLAPYPAAARLRDLPLHGLESLAADEAAVWLDGLLAQGGIPTPAMPPLEEALERLRFLADLGLGYLAPARAADRLSRGELKRVRLAAACAARMSGLLYVLDEPLAGCHPRERAAVRRKLRALVGAGNTVVSVEHDPEAVRGADRVVELGPGAGREGGSLVAEGTPREVERGDTAMGRALRRPAPSLRDEPRHESEWVRVTGASFRNLHDVEARFPVQGLTCVTGVSGAGKSSLVFGILAPLAEAALAERSGGVPRGWVKGLDAFQGVSAAAARAGRHPRALPLTLLGVFGPLRELYAATLEARARGWGPSRFSLGVAGGRCEACRGTGDHAVALRDAPEVHVPCEVCGGRRYGPDLDAVRVKGLSVADLLALTVGEGAAVFRDLPRVGPALRAAAEVGLGYVPLGRPATRLSLGEVLRLRLAAALGRGGTGPTLYLLDEPAAGLHPDDVRHLLRVLERLVAAGHAVVAVEHDLDVISAADHVIELGPGPGERGGRVLYQGPPAGLADVDGAPTGAALSARSTNRAANPTGGAAHAS
jgi:excinuclease ABC subunit A